MDIISTYTKADAVEDGQQVDVSDTSEAKEAGFKIPVYLTCGVHDLVEVPASLQGSQDYKGRLWDTLFLAAQAQRAFVREFGAGHPEANLIPYEVIYQTDPVKCRQYTLWLCFHPSEGFTIMLPSEY